MKIKMLKTVEVEVEMKNSDVSIKSGKSLLDRNTTEILMKDEEYEVTILKEKKGTAEIEFSDGSTGKLQSNTFKKIKVEDLVSKD